MGVKQSRSSERVARNINRLIGERKTTKAEVHRAAGLAMATFHDKLRNRPGAFSVEELESIAQALGVNAEDLFKA